MGHGSPQVSEKSMNKDYESENKEPHDLYEEFEESVFSIFENMSIDNTIIQITESLQTTQDSIIGKFEIRDTLELYRQDIKSKKVNKESIAELYFSLIMKSKNKEERAQKTFLLACIYTSLAQIAFWDDRMITAWRAISKAQYFLGLLSGLSDPFAQALAERASKGGKKASDNAKYAKKRIIDLLIEERPQGGWHTPKNTAYVLADPLLKIIEKEKLTLPKNREDLIQHLLNLILDDKDAKHAYNNSSLSPAQ